MEEKKRISRKSVTSKAGSTKTATAGSKTRARAEGAGKAASASVTAKKKPTAKRASLPPPSKPDVDAIRRAKAREMAIAIAHAALDKKAERIEIVDIGEKVDYADYLVVMTGRSDRQVVAIAQGIEEALHKRGSKTVGVEGLPQGHWVLLDYGDVIVHIFLEEARKYYDLEGLWMDAPRVPTPAFVPASPIPAGTGS